MSSQKRRFWLLLAGAVLLCQQGLRAQRTAPLVPQYQEQPPFDLKRLLHTKGDWQGLVTADVEPSREFESDQGPSQSRICFVRTDSAARKCAYFRDLFHSNLTFQVFSSLSPVLLESGTATTSGLQLKAAALYPAGQVEETAIWAYDAAEDDWNLAFADGSNEVRILNSGALNGLLITSHWHLDEGENRWSDHRRDITVYRYSPDGGQAGYRRVREYRTAKKYGAEDTATIDAELNNIEAMLR